MNPYFFTFGTGHEYRGYFVEIVAPREEQARAVMESMHGKRWSFCYGAEAFKGQPEKWGYCKLATVRLHRNGEFYADHPQREKADA